jgi:TraM recognition site of TraD and TraG
LRDQLDKHLRLFDLAHAALGLSSPGADADTMRRDAAETLAIIDCHGLKAYLITQDIRQIVDEYGPNESIVSNCHVRIAYAPNQYETAELLSLMTGTKTV